MIFLRWVTGTPPCDPNLSQTPGNHCSFTSREASAARAASFKSAWGKLGPIELLAPARKSASAKNRPARDSDSGVRHGSAQGLGSQELQELHTDFMRTRFQHSWLLAIVPAVTLCAERPSGAQGSGDQNGSLLLVNVADGVTQKLSARDTRTVCYGLFAIFQTTGTFRSLPSSSMM